MADQKPQPLLEAMKIAKGTKPGLPIQIQNMVKEIAESSDTEVQKGWAKDVARWLYAECNKEGADEFTILGYTALRNALAPYMPEGEY
ncbi:MAG: hypothetical protein NVS9B12_00730 [Vulcanimicrobiaceae bacterium]